MKKIPLHKKLLLGAVTGGLGYGSYKLFKHTDAGSRKMEMISPVTPLLLVADDERRKAAIAGGVGAGVGAAGASRLFKAPYAKSVDKAAGEVAGHINSLKDDLGKTPWYKFGKKRAIKSEIADVFKAGQSDIARTISKGRKAGVAGAVVGGIVGGVAGAGLYASRHDLKNKINNLYNKTISKENRTNLVKSSDSKYRDLYIPYGAVGGTLAGAAIGIRRGKTLPVAALGTIGGAATGGLAAGRGYLAEKRGVHTDPVSNLGVMGLTTAGAAGSIYDVLKSGGYIGGKRAVKSYLSHGAVGALAGVGTGAAMMYHKDNKENRPNLVNSAENDDYVRTGAVTGGILGMVGRKGFAVAPVLGGAALGAGMGYLAKKNSNDNYNSPIKDHIKAIAKTTIPLGAAGGAAAVHIGSKAIDKAMKEKPHLVSQLPAHVLENVKQLKGAKGALIGAGVGAAGAALSSPVFGSIYGGAVHLKRAITEKNNIKSSEAQESLRRVNEIIAGLTVKQATPIFKKIVAKKKALGASTSQAQKAALKILHRIDK